MNLDLRQHFSIFRDAAPGRIHLAAHSHHYWPDAACRAHEQAVRQAARLADAKWGPIFQELMPRVRRGRARILNLPDEGTLAFAPNTHELVGRLLSSLPLSRPPRVLTSDSEFHSFERQLCRLAEEHLVAVTRVAAAPSHSFPDRFLATARTGEHDLIFVSQVFYNSGSTCGDIAALAEAIASRETLERPQDEMGLRHA